jgi:ABC-type phosphate/phosphonate transport system permease subunit
MQTQNLHINKSLNFSRWSRKAYASFNSIGKIVKISTLKTIVAQGFIKKSKSFTEIELFYNLTKDNNKELDDIVTTLIPITLTAQQPQLNDYYSRILNNLTIKIFSLFISVSICLRFFVSQNSILNL